MKIKITLLIALLMILWASPAFGYDLWKGEFNPWTKEDTYWQLGVLATQIIDWGQTRYNATHPDEFYETNLILGEHPSLSEVDRYFIVCIAGNYMISKILPENWRRKWQVGTILFQAYFVKNNYNLGIGTRF